MPLSADAPSTWHVDLLAEEPHHSVRLARGVRHDERGARERRELRELALQSTALRHRPRRRAAKELQQAALTGLAIRGDVERARVSVRERLRSVESRGERGRDLRRLPDSTVWQPSARVGMARAAASCAEDARPSGTDTDWRHRALSVAKIVNANRLADEELR